MNTKLFHSFFHKLLIISLMFATIAKADDTTSPDIPDGIVKVTTVEPERDVGYTIGDTLNRTIKFEVKKPYTMVKSSLPIVGYEHRFKGQVTGIEVKSINFTESANGDSTDYEINLTYQIFTNNVVAKAAFLPAEKIKFSGAGKVYQLRVPEWGFRISPIAIFGSVKIEQDMSPMRKPLLISDAEDVKEFKLYILALGIGCLGLLYILGARAWLPLMGKPFAKALREIKHLPKTNEGLNLAVGRVHQSFNATAGGSVFSSNLDSFLSQNPSFSAIKPDIERFFALSRQVYFDPQSPSDIGTDPYTWLRQFVRSCRDCERGLKPNLITVR